MALLASRSQNVLLLTTSPPLTPSPLEAYTTSVSGSRQQLAVLPEARGPLAAKHMPLDDQQLASTALSAESISALC